jgi:SAM-dependent methyltransferase
MDDWYTNFLGDVLPGKYGWIDRFNHTYAARSAHAGARTLEIGPGNGSHLQFENIAEQDEYIGIELRESLSSQMADLPANVKVVVGDCQHGLDFPDASFDRVLAIHVLEHLDNLPAALAEIHRVLKPSGKFSIVIPCEGGLGYKLGRRVTVQRKFEQRYGLPYDWMISYDHVNQAWEVLREVRQRFRVGDTSYFPVKVPSIDLNLVIGLTVSPH